MNAKASEKTKMLNLFTALTELLKECKFIDLDQKKMLDDIFIQSVPHYESPEKAELIKVFVESLTMTALEYVHGNEIDSQSNLAQKLKHDFSILNSPTFRVSDLYSSRSVREKALQLFLGIGLVTMPDQDTISPTRTFGVFPNTLCRIFYPTPFESPFKHKIAKLLRTNLDKLNNLPEEIKSEVFHMVGSVSRTIFTDLHSTGSVDSVNVYELGPTVYRDEDQSVFVFSRTPGILIPEEYYGTTKKEYHRKVYFEQGMLGHYGKKIRKYYQWNGESAALALYSGYLDASKKRKGAEYRLSAANVLLRFVSQPQFEITEAIFGKYRVEVSRIKLMLTLANRSVHIFSNRDEVRKNIIGKSTVLGGVEGKVGLSHFLSEMTSETVMPIWETSTKLGKQKKDISIYDALKGLYDEDTTVIIKSFGETLNLDASLNIVDRLISRGKELRRKGMNPK